MWSEYRSDAVSFIHSGVGALTLDAFTTSAKIVWTRIKAASTVIGSVSLMVAATGAISGPLGARFRSQYRHIITRATPMMYLLSNPHGFMRDANFVRRWYCRRVSGIQYDIGTPAAHPRQLDNAAVTPGNPAQAWQLATSIPFRRFAAQFCRLLRPA